MWLGEALHALKGWLVEVEFQVKCLSDRRVRDVVVPVAKALISACEVHGGARVIKRIGSLEGENQGTGVTHVGPMPPLVTTKS